MSLILTRFSVLSALLCTLLASGAASAEGGPCDIPPEYKLGRPDPPGTPTEVSVLLFLLNIYELDEVSETFELDVAAGMSWRDPRLSARQLGRSLEHCSFTRGQLWDPGVTAINRRGQPELTLDRVIVTADGVVTYQTRAFGRFVSPLDLREFPLDTQELTVSLASFHYGEDEVVFTGVAEPGRLAGLHFAGWDLISLHQDPKAESYVDSLGVGHSHYRLTLTAKRQFGFFLWKVFVPLGLIVLMGWSVFWLDPAAWAPQLGVATASVFSLIAFLLSLRSLLPPISYLTRADQVVLGGTLLVFGALGEVIFTSRLAQSGKEELARQVDEVGRWVYLVLVAMLFAVGLGL